MYHDGELEACFRCYSSTQGLFLDDLSSVRQPWKLIYGRGVTRRPCPMWISPIYLDSTLVLETWIWTALHLDILLQLTDSLVSVTFSNSGPNMVITYDPMHLGPARHDRDRHVVCLHCQRFYPSPELRLQIP